MDWRGNPIKREVHGGVRAAWYMYCKSLHTKLNIRYIFLNYIFSHLQICVLDVMYSYFQTSSPLNFSPYSPDSCNKHGECPNFAEFGHLSPRNNAYGSIELSDHNH